MCRNEADEILHLFIVVVIELNEVLRDCLQSLGNIPFFAAGVSETCQNHSETLQT